MRRAPSWLLSGFPVISNSPIEKGLFMHLAPGILPGVFCSDNELAAHEWNERVFSLGCSTSSSHGSENAAKFWFQGSVDQRTQRN